MIEELEADAVAHLIALERGEEHAKARIDLKGTAMEVRARRRKDGGVVLGYSYGGVRLERAVLLLLVCPVSACQQSRNVKQQWHAQNPQPPILQRRLRGGLKVAATGDGAKLFEELTLCGEEGTYEVRPALFVVRVECPLKAHEQTIMQMKGWDLFKAGQYVAGGLSHCRLTGGPKPHFDSPESASAWIDGHKKSA